MTEQIQSCRGHKARRPARWNPHHHDAGALGFDWAIRVKITLRPNGLGFLSIMFSIIPSLG
jgi:hypothetical protein